MQDFSGISERGNSMARTSVEYKRIQHRQDFSGISERRNSMGRTSVEYQKEGTVWAGLQ